ncbi:MAG: DUF1343 domain-containing protein [Bacteroidota bacterium]|nr:DUF1343 domain-containing protein [Bacteroidota bacterium]
MKIIVILLFCFASLLRSEAQNENLAAKDAPAMPGAYRMSEYLSFLQNKKVAVFANATSLVGSTHLVDTLRKRGINIIKIFAPEHGFRGAADAGASVGNDTDRATGIPIISLYGKKEKPSAEDLHDVDILVFDIQDVGVRFYTYIGSLQYCMEAAFEMDKPLLILDRPNPNGFYVDGDVLDTAYRSFVGMQPVPVVYGMTIGEYAMMIAGEHWLSTAAANEKYNKYKNKPHHSADTPFHFLVITCANYSHKTKYQLPVAPSPNLASMGAVYWYPSTCFFEGTNLSEGRGTGHPFEIFGHPSLPNTLFSFTPHSNKGATYPKWKDKTCYGWNLTKEKPLAQLNLHWLLEAYRLFPEKDSFFINPKSAQPTHFFFNKLAGNSILMQQIREGKTEAQIRASWQSKLKAFKIIRKKYLLYKDF